jgi:hypothetical protein
MRLKTLTDALSKTITVTIHLAETPQNFSKEATQWAPNQNLSEIK